MAKLSLLDMTQNILSALDSDPVNSIDDTVESVQVAEVIRECYYDLMSQREWPFLRKLTTLDGLGDTTNPTHMGISDTHNKVYWIKYNKKEVTYMSPDLFHNMIALRVPQTGVINNDGYVINADPTYWTSYDDQTIVFDGYNSAVDTTLQSSKSAVYVLTQAPWTHTDNYIPDIPEKVFPTLLAEAKATCFLNLKQQQNPREERRAQRGRVVMLNSVWKNNAGEAKYNGKVDYGR